MPSHEIVDLQNRVESLERKLVEQERNIDRLIVLVARHVELTEQHHEKMFDFTPSKSTKL